MNVINAITLVAAAANFGIGFFVLTRNYRKPLFFSFALFSFITGFWILSNFFFAIYPSKFLLESQYATGAIVMPFALVWFGLLLDGHIKLRNIFYLVGLSILLFFIPFIGDSIIEKFEILEHGNYYLKLSNFFNFYSFVLIFLYTFTVAKIFLSFRKSKGIRRAQLKYILAGALGYGSISITFSFLLPLFKVALVAPIDAQSSLIFVSFSVYAIIRHRLLDIKFIVTRSLIYGILVTLVAFSFIFITLFSAQFFGDTQISRNVIALIVAFLIVFGLEPFKRLLSRITDNIFFKAKVDYQTLLTEVSEVLNLELDANVLLREVTKTLREGLKIKSAVILLRDKEGNFATRADGYPNTPQFHLPRDSALVRYLQEHEHITVFESLERKIEDTRDPEQLKELERSRSEFNEVKAAAITPVITKDKLVALLLLGQKLSGDSFNLEEYRLFQTISPQIATALEKARLFGEVKEFSKTLEQKVEQATKELSQRNLSLVAIQRVTNLITSSLDFDKVAQGIADGLSHELGYVGGILLFLNPVGDKLQPRAITATPITARALKLLPKPFAEYYGDVKRDTTLGIRAIKERKILIADHLAEAISPPVPRLVVEAIQKLTGIKAVVAVPILSEGRPVGVMDISVAKPKEAITARELEVLQSIADQTGIAARNLHFIEEIKEVNKNLEVANEHLKQLDQAKSEFISIASHQLRTPMTGIMGYLSMITSGDFGPLKKEHATILENLLKESKRMIRLINLFLNVSKIEAGKFEITKSETQIEELVESVRQELLHIAEDKGISIGFIKPDPLLPKAFVDGDKIRDTMLNLIDNAIKYTHEGKITITAKADADSVTVSVADTGVGINPAEAQNLFGKFVRGSGIARIQPDGSGLGLFIAKKVVEAHGGTIWVESEGEGKGSTFSFSVPLRLEGGATAIETNP